eukprot:scaffold409_cov167-Ochromonas_danica.AAC.22
MPKMVLASSSSPAALQGLSSHPVFLSIKKNINVLLFGAKGFLVNLKEGNRLRKLMKQSGMEALTFSEFKLLETVKHDLSKSLRMLLFLPLSPELFFYSYILGPMISFNNPWAWQSLPSTFDDAADAKVRERALVKRRLNTAMFSIHQLKIDTMDDKDAGLRKKRGEQVELIERALQAPTLAAALQILQPLLITDRKHAATLKCEHVPPTIIKECIRSFGVDGVPAWLPVVRRMNHAELRQYFDRLRRSDDFLFAKGLKEMSLGELQVACFERGIGTNRPEAQLRQDLTSWLQTLTPKEGAAPPSSLSKLQENVQNRRFAMVALNVAKEIKTSDFASTYRHILK